MKPINKNLRFWLLSFPLLALAVASTASVHAVEYTYDNAAAAGIQTTSGNWATTATNWTEDGGTTRIGWPNTGTDSARVTGTLASDAYLNINSADIQLDDFASDHTGSFFYIRQLSSDTGRTLTLTGGTYDETGTTGSQFTINGGAVSLLGGTLPVYLQGTADLVKKGPGPLFFATANNSATGNIHIEQGALVVTSGSDSSLGNAANNIFLNGGIFRVQSASLSIASGRSITLGASDGTLHAETSGTMTVGGIVTGTGNLTKTGAGTVELAAASTYNGSTTISAGTLRLNANGTIPNSSNLTINGSGSLNVRNTASWIHNGTITGDGTGSIALNTSTNATLAGNISGVPTITASSAGTDTTISGNISGAATATISGGAILTLSGDNSAMGGGGVSLSGGTASRLNIGNANALGTGTLTFGGANHTFDNTSGADLTLASNNAQVWNNEIIFAGTHSLNLGNGPVALGGGRTIFAQANSLTIGGAISGAFGISKASGGALILAGASSYTGNTVIAQGVLQINSIKNYGTNSALGAPLSGDIQLGSGNNFCSLLYTGSGDSTDRTIQLGNSNAVNDGVGTIKNNGSGNLIFTAANFNPTIPGVTTTRTLWLGGTYTGGSNEIQGIIQNNDTGGKINVGKGDDASTWTLSGANTYSGFTLVQGGTLKLGASASIINSSSVSINTGGTLNTNAQSTYTIPGAQPVTFGIDAGGGGSTGKIVAAGLNVGNAVVTYNIAGTPDDPVYVLATYTSLTGTPSFASVSAPPSGYTLDYAYQGNKIALVKNAPGGYDSWKAQITNGLNLRTDDADGDGNNNLQEFLFGTSPIAGNGSLVTATAGGGNLVLRWLQRETGATYSLKQSPTLMAGSWTAVVSPIPAIDGNQTGAPTNYDYHTVALPTSGGKLFFKIEGVEN